MADTCVDLFCGAGGFSHGFKDSNTRFIGVDSDPIKLGTYAYNIGGETIKADVLELDPSTLGKVKYLIGSHPCQPHSGANRFATHDHQLIQRYVDIRNYLKPKWWVMEEVPGAAYVLDEAGQRIIKDWEVRFLKASDFGLNHRRRRLFAGNYPNPKKTIYSGSMKIKTPVAQVRGYGHGKEDRHAILKKAYELIEGEVYNDVNELRFCDVVTPEFYAMIMGFPGDYTFFGTKDEQFVQIGNAVCPPVAKAIWEAIKSGRQWKVQTTLM